MDRSMLDDMFLSPVVGHTENPELQVIDRAFAKEVPGYSSAEKQIHECGRLLRAAQRHAANLMTRIRVVQQLRDSKKRRSTSDEALWRADNHLLEYERLSHDMI